METKITANYFEYGNQKYFRGNANMLVLGTYGQKKDPLGAKASLDPQYNVDPDHLAGRVQIGPIVTVDWSKTSKADFEVNGALQYFGLNGKIELNGNYEKVKTAHLRLANFFMMEASVKTMLNNGATVARNYLKDEGNDGRLVTEIWVGLEVELGEHFAANASGSVSVKKSKTGKLELSASGGIYGTQTISVSPGKVFAYKLHKVTDWVDKIVVNDLEADYKGVS